MASRWSLGDTKMRPLLVKLVGTLTSASLNTDFSPTIHNNDILKLEKKKI